MVWNWQQKDWPHFRYNKTLLEEAEAQFLHYSGIVLGAFKHLDKNQKTKLIIELISTEAVKTSEIEGEYLDRMSVQSSLCKYFGIPTDARAIPAPEKGIADLMVDLYESFAKPLKDEQLFAWHTMLFYGSNSIQERGKWRTSQEPMQVVSGPVHKPIIHFEAPPSRDVPYQMELFIEWFNSTAPSESSPLPALTRAALAHLYFISIHPFEDGNGRIARALSEKALAQGTGNATLAALSLFIAQHRKEYYKALEEATRTNEATPWIVYFAHVVLEAQDYTRLQVEFIIAKTKFYDRFRDELNVRQVKVIERIFSQGLKGFEGGLSAEKYINITKTSRATATRDLYDLVTKGILIRTGELKYTRYYLNIDGDSDG